MNPNRPIDRFIKYLRNNDISNSNAEKQLEIANGYINNAAKEGRSGAIGSEILSKISETFLDLNLIWLITDKGQMTPDNMDHTPHSNDQFSTENPIVREDNPVQKYGVGVRPTVRPTVRATQNLSEKGLNLGVPLVVTVDLKGYNTISLVNVKARAGYLNGYGDVEFIEALPSYTMPGFNNGTFRAFETEGNSMSPTLKHGDITFCEWKESLKDIRDGRVHVIVTKSDGILVKRLLNRIDEYGYIVAKSDNIDRKNEYPNIKVYPEDVVELWYPRIYLSAEFKDPGDTHKRLNDLEAAVVELQRLNGIN